MIYCDINLAIPKFEKECKIKESHAMSILDRSDLFLKEEEFCDAVLVATVPEKKKFPVHRVLMSAASEFFRRLFANPLEEETKKEFQLKNVHAPSLAVLIRFVYTGSLLLTDANLQLVLETADYLQMNGAVDACSAQLMARIELSNCLWISAFAKAHTMLETHTAASRFISLHFEQLWQSEDFLSQSLDCVVDILKDDSLASMSEEVVSSAALRWIRHDEANRKKFTQTLMGCIRMDELDPQFIHAFLWDVCAESNCLSMLKRVFLSPRITRGQLVKSTRSNRSRIVTDTLFCIKGKSTECFLPTPDYWMQLSSISLAKTAAVWLENFMFQYEAKVQVFDFISWTSQNPSALPQGMGVVEMAVLNDELYAVANNLTGSVSRLKQLGGTWEVLPSLPTSRKNFSVTVLDNQLFVIGGQDAAGNELNIVEKFDRETNSWSASRVMIESRSDFSTAALNGYIYAVGGANNSTEMERYDPGNDLWESMNPVPDKCFARSVQAYDNSLVAVLKSKSVWRYNPSIDWWTEMPSLRDDEPLAFVLVIQKPAQEIKFKEMLF